MAAYENNICGVGLLFLQADLLRAPPTKIDFLQAELLRGPPIKRWMILKMSLPTTKIAKSHTKRLSLSASLSLPLSSPPIFPTSPLPGVVAAASKGNG